MLSTTIVHRCRCCGSERIRKNGHANNGAPRAKCLECGRTFHLEPKGARYDESFKAQVVSAYQARMSTRGVRRTFGVCYQTLMKWVGEKIQGLPEFTDTLLPSEAGDALELDELWSFVHSKAQECWLWIALCRRTRQIVAYTPPSATAAGRERKACANTCRPTTAAAPRAATSGWPTRGTFPARTHRFCGKEAGETNHAERFFGTVRSRLGRLIRRTYSLSKKVERHLDAIHLFLTGYHLAIKQATIP